MDVVVRHPWLLMVDVAMTWRNSLFFDRQEIGWYNFHSIIDSEHRLNPVWQHPSVHLYLITREEENKEERHHSAEGPVKSVASLSLLHLSQSRTTSSSILIENHKKANIISCFLNNMLHPVSSILLIEMVQINPRQQHVSIWVNNCQYKLIWHPVLDLWNCTGPFSVSLAARVALQQRTRVIL